MPAAMEFHPPHQQALGQVLLRQGALSEDHLRIALREQMSGGGRLGRLLVSLGFLAEPTLREALGSSLGLPTVSLGELEIKPEVLAMVPTEMARQYQILPLELRAGRLRLAMANVRDIVALDQLQGLMPPDVTLEPLISGEGDIARAIDRHYGHSLSIDGILHEIETGEIDRISLAEFGGEYSQPVVRLVNLLIADAVKLEASDIHFEPEQNFLRIRYRIDGMLRQVRALHKSLWPSMAVRLKVIGGLDIAETRAPQDGRVSLDVNGRAVDIRLSVQPTLYGENLVLRLLDRQKGLVPLEELGLRESHLGELRRMMARPEGIILVTGPTGSGKTTTLYAILSQINQESINIMTLEDPVEYPLPMVRQTSIGEANRLNFADGIRSLMRQDPDVILVGEIRDKDTAEMAFRAAMTGHQVYSTLHSNGAVGAIPRLLDMGVQPEILAGNVVGIIAQRLVRRLCPACRQAHPADRTELAVLGLPPEGPAPDLFHPVGCAACDFQGYRGRVAIMELLRLDADLDELLARRATVREIGDAALGKGMVSLAADGLARVLDGTTTLAEVRRVVDLSRG